jgi:hypothetical protein
LFVVHRLGFVYSYTSDNTIMTLPCLKGCSNIGLSVLHGWW